MHISTSARLTSRERMIRALTRQPMDRIPRHDSFWGETYDRWLKEGLPANDHASAMHRILDELGSDIHCISWTVPTPYPGRKDVFDGDHASESYIDEWGERVRYWKNRDGAPEHLGFECTDRDHWEQQVKPQLQAWRLVDRPDDLRASAAAAERCGKWRFINILETFEALRRIIGDECMMYAMIEEPDWIRDMSATYTDTVLRYMDEVIACGVDIDGIWCYGDMAFKTATFCSPAMYRDLVWPDHKRIADWVHARGGHWIYHTDGNVNAVIPDYLDAGFDCLQPLESKAGMDVRILVPQYGERISFCGNIDVMILKTNERDRIETEIREKFAAAMPGNGYIYHSDHSIPPQVSLDTYRFVIDCVNRYGAYE